jgi:hypothetical protein
MTTKLSLHERLLKVQEDMPSVKKDVRHTRFEGKKYADINSYVEVLKPILSKHGVHLMQLLDTTPEGNIIIRTIVSADGPNGHEKYESSMGINKNPDPQKLGSEITYFRRYMVQCMFFAQAEDDDAETSIDRSVPAPAPAQQRTYTRK